MKTLLILLFLYLTISLFVIGCSDSNNPVTPPPHVNTYQDSIVKLCSPPNDTIVNQNGNIYFTWNKTVNAATYELNYSLLFGLDTLWYSSNEFVNDTTYCIGFSYVTAIGTWRVRVHNPNTPFPGWSETRRFTVQ